MPIKLSTKEYTGAHIGDLVALCRLPNGLWRYLCVRQKNGRPCGNTRDILRKRVSNYSSCAECGLESLWHDKKITMLNFKKLRASFNPAQWKKYYGVLRGRTALEDQRDAVEIVILESDLDEGQCCKICAEGKLQSRA
jgi:hypothetical protein